MGDLAARLKTLHPAWIGVLGFLLYAPTVQYGYTGYDDTWLTRDNFLLREPSADAVRRVVTDLSWEQRFRLGAEYLPVRDLSIMLDSAIYGDSVAGFHLTQVALYGAVCALFATLTLALFGDRRLAWLVGLLFTVHPVHVEAVAWLAERKGLLGALFTIASLLAATAYLRRGATRYAVAACALFLLAVASKAVTIASAGALVLLVLWIASSIPTRRRVGFLVAYVASGLVVFVPYLRVARTFGVIAADSAEGPLDALLRFCVVHTHYLELMALRGPYAIRYGLDPHSTALLDWLPGALAGLLAVVLVGLAVLGRAPRNPLTWGIGWWLVFLAPVSHLFASVQNDAADRYLFLPSYGLLLAFGVVLLRLPRTPRWLLGTLCVVVSCAWTFVQMPAWADGPSLFENAVQVDPSDARAWDKLALFAAEDGDTDLALERVDEGLRHSPSNWRLLHRRALVLDARGERDQAIAQMKQAASVPEADIAYANLALLHLRRGERSDALQAANQAVALQARRAHNQRVLGIVTYELGETARACEAFSRAFALDPYDHANRKNLELCDDSADGPADP